METWTTRTVLKGSGKHPYKQHHQIEVGQATYHLTEHSSPKQKELIIKKYQPTSSGFTCDNPQMSGLKEREQQHTLSLLVDHPVLHLLYQAVAT